MSNSNVAFLLESFHFNNFSVEELIKKAEAEDNRLALALYETAKEEIEEEIEAKYADPEADSAIHAPTAVDYIVYEAEWIKDEDNNRYIFGDFNEDTNVYNNHVEIEVLGGRKYKIRIAYDFLGESEFSEVVSGLKEAKEAAKRKALNIAAKGELGI